MVEHQLQPLRAGSLVCAAHCLTPAIQSITCMSSVTVKHQWRQTKADISVSPFFRDALLYEATWKQNRVI